MLQTSALYLCHWMQVLISQEHTTSANGVSWETRHSIGLLAALCMKFLLLRNENGVLQSGELLLLASEPGFVATESSQPVCRASHQSQGR